MVLKVQGKFDQSGATKGVCQNCGKTGHYIKDCWAKGGNDGQAPAWYKEHRDLAKQADEPDFAFMASDMTLVTIIPSDWIADSGSSTQIAQNRLDFTNYIVL